ncbi:MAG: sigma-54 interaction domain-containing protein [Desulfohalobiaceae bacterium]
MPIAQPRIIGKSPAINKVLEITQKVSNVDLNVLITGESGVGKELVARALHFYSPRADKPFIKVNSAALPSELIESELFGYEKGAFTGAEKRKPGKFEHAEQGSIFLDEIGEIPLFLQAKLLQVLHDRRYHRIGGRNEVEVQARVIAATNQNLDSEICQGHFRDDLYYRLSTISIHIPPLRERKEDIPILVEHFLGKIKSENQIKNVRIPESLMQLFQEYHWPGNVRELGNFLSRLCVLDNPHELEEEILHNMRKPGRNVPETAKLEINNSQENDAKSLFEDLESLPSLREVREQAVKRVEKEIISKVLRLTNWNRKETARILQISYRALLYKIKELDLHPPYR